MAVQLKLRRDTAANWTSTNPTLAQGEPGYETDTGKLKIGNGSTAWNSLAYQAAANIVDGTIVNDDINASAAIAGTKIAPDFGAQNVTTTGTSTAASYNPTSATVPANGVYLPAANSIGISTGTTERLRIDSSGRFGIGTASPGATLHIYDGTAASLRLGQASVTYNSYVDSGYYVCGTQTNHPFVFTTNNTERARLDSSGRLLVGTSTTRAVAGNFGGTTNQLLFETVDVASFSAVGNKNDSSGPILALGKSRSGTIGGVTAVQSEDILGAIKFAGANGTDLSNVGAEISAVVDGTPFSSGDTTDLPGRLIFATTADGASSPTERLRITSTGQLRLAGAGITFNGDTATANELDDYEEGTFTPVIQGTTTAGTGTYSVQVGRYVKIGKTVTVWIRLTWSAHTGTGIGVIAALPFTAQTIAGGHHPFAATIGYETNYDVAANTVLSAYVEPNGTRIFFAQIGVGTQSGASSAALDTAAGVTVTATYETA